MNLYVNRPSNPYKNLALALLLVAALLIPGYPAFAAAPQTLGSMTNSVYDSLLTLQTFLSLLSYTAGVYFTITGLKHIRDHVVDPGNNPLKVAAFRLAASAFFIFAPYLANTLIVSIGGLGVGVSNDGMINYANNGVTPTDSGTGPEGALMRFVLDFADPFLSYLLPFFAWAAGMILMLIGLKRMAQGTFDDPRGESVMGTAGTFFVAATLMSLGYIMYTLNFSLFGSSATVYSNPLVNSANGGVDAALAERINQTMWGVFIFLRIVGYISVVRGLFMLRGVAEGQNTSMMAVGTHLIAGALLANATAFVLAAQSTFVASQADYILKPL